MSRKEDTRTESFCGDGASPGIGRRSFLSWTWRGLGVLVAFESLWLLLSFVLPRKTGAEKQPKLIVAGPEEQFLPNSVTAFPEGKFYLARLADGGFLALGRECTHLGCTLIWKKEKGQFLCPCHASAFDLRGEVVNPPAPRSLDIYPVLLENHDVKVDISKRSKRDGFDPSQVAYHEK